jgi:2-dehydro-3-deoxygluconokinase
VLTALADNEVGRLIEGLVCQGGVDTRDIVWVPYDGIGHQARNGLNFTERGFGVRGALGVSDRGHTAASQLRADDFDWDDIFGRRGVRWLHTGGIFAGLSETTGDVVEAAMKAAKAHGTIISYDLNFRPSLWQRHGGSTGAREVNRRLAGYVDVMIGNEEDFTMALGFDVPNTSADMTDLDVRHFRTMIEEVTNAFPNLRVIATTLREVLSASINHWGAVAWVEGSFVEATHRRDLAILDRVGGGDSFASGLIYGLMTGRSPVEAVELGAAHGALAMTTPGDTSMVTLSEVERLAAGGGARVLR